MLERIVRYVRSKCDAYLESKYKKTWVPHSEDHNDPYCSHCGYMCDRCFRPM